MGLLNKLFKPIYIDKDYMLSTPEDFIHIDISECEQKDDRLPKIIDSIASIIGNHTDSAFVCGGFAASLTPHSIFRYGDIDIYCCPTSRALTDISAEGNLVKVHSPHSSVYRFDKLKANINLIDLKKDESLTRVIKNFDMNWCMAGISFDTNELIYHKDILLEHPVFNACLIDEENEDCFFYEGEALAGRLLKYMKRRINTTLTQKQISKIVKTIIKDQDLKRRLRREMGY